MLIRVLCIKKSPMKITSLGANFIPSTDPTQKGDNRKLTTNRADKRKPIAELRNSLSKKERTVVSRGPRQINSYVRDSVYVCVKRGNEGAAKLKLTLGFSKQSGKMPNLPTTLKNRSSVCVFLTSASRPQIRAA